MGDSRRGLIVPAASCGHARRATGRLTGRAGMRTIMLRTMLKSKIHRAVLTGADLHYEGSIAIDQNLLDRANILSGEQVQVLNVNNGSRLITYAIAAPRGSGTILLNGPAARLGMAGDTVVIITYCQVTDEEAKKLKPIVVHMDKNNKPKKK